MLSIKFLLAIVVSMIYSSIAFAICAPQNLMVVGGQLVGGNTTCTLPPSNPPPPPGGDVLFSDNFDSQADWTSAMYSTAREQFAKDKIPTGWYAIRQDPTWAPSTGHADRHESIEVLARNSDKARGGKGKSYVSWRDSHDPGSNRWNSESILAWVSQNNYQALYVEFWIRFAPNWTTGSAGGTSKIFRVFSWNRQPSIFSFFGDGNSGPIFLWDWSESDSYGVRNRLAFRGGPHGKNYSMSNEALGSNRPADIVSGSLGDISANFTTHTEGRVGGATPRIPDKVNGGYISDNMKQIVRHRQIYGDESKGAQWTKLAFYVQMNSAPGVNDGQYRQWIDDVRIVDMRQVRWVATAPMVGWNAVAIGGNDFFNSYPNSDRHEEWYSIDDFVIRSTIPTNLR